MTRMSKFILIFSLLITSLGIELTHAQAILSPPFGLKWGDTPEKLLTWAERQKLDTEILLPGRQPTSRIIKIKASSGPLPGSKATSVESRYQDGKLYEVTLHYANPSLTASQSKTQFLAAKKALSTRHGSFKLSHRKRNSENQFSTETIAYHIEPISGIFLMLTYTEVTDELRKQGKGKFSLIYRNENILQPSRAVPTE